MNNVSDQSDDGEEAAETSARSRAVVLGVYAVTYLATVLAAALAAVLLSYEWATTWPSLDLSGIAFMVGATAVLLGVAPVVARVVTARLVGEVPAVAPGPAVETSSEAAKTEARRRE